ncbi:hypothetical protein KVH31_13345 [Streptomyces olivaceus]|uniref:hypothetical protein n=1 Tax=Streptomyces olivaceus TaxID=47716 RepID=UPI001CD01315|nr:hypothetical protein [Streptomyces olivaceus]MBZ6207483.1 hypothetical protein [Streptomyces olivaceus]
MTDRIPLDDLTSDQLEALYDQLATAQQRAENFEGRAAAFERRHATLKRAHVALAEQAGRDQASLARVRALGDRIEEFAKTALKADDRELYAAIASDIRRKIDGASEASGYCPACGRGDCAPTPDEYEQQRQRADRAEAALARVHHLADLIHAGAPWTANHTELATRIRAAAGPAPAATDTATWTAVRAIQLMNEAGQQRDEALAAIARVRGLRERARTEAPASQGPTWEGLDLALHDALPPAEQTTE